jgi:hypothetical protein
VSVAARPGRRYVGAMRYQGRCHCGNLELEFETARAPEALELRACSCSFCTRHGAIAATDPDGRLEIRVRDPAGLSRYVFGLRTAEFLVCRSCGTYVAAVCSTGGATYATLNVNVLDDRVAFTQRPRPVEYDGETAEARLARRKRVWTPATVG